MLIDAYELTRQIERMKDVNRDDVIALIARQKPVDAEPVRHGRWIDASGMILCSECGDSWGTETEEMVRSFNYCPNCGAKMDVEEQDETN